MYQNVYCAEKAEGVRGDVNLDGKLSLADAVALQKHISGAANAAAPENGDLSGDGRVNVFDLSIMKMEL